MANGPLVHSRQRFCPLISPEVSDLGPGGPLMERQMGIVSLKSCTDFYGLRVLGVYLDEVLISKGRFITLILMLQRCCGM